MQRWNWFMAVDWFGRWTTTGGTAEVETQKSTLRATLRFSDDTDPYHRVEGSISPDGTVTVTVRSENPQVPPFELTGEMRSGEVPGKGESTTIVLSDGTTVLGLAFGTESKNGNL